MAPTYCTLSYALFTADGSIADVVKFRDLAHHVYFTETGEPLPSNSARSPLLGVHNSRAVCLLYNGILDDKRTGQGNVLTREVLADLQSAAKTRLREIQEWVIYGTANRISPARLKTMNTTFKQIPYAVRTK